MSIILYSTSSRRNNESLAPNPWKTRLCLRFKGISFETKLVEYPDIQDISIKNGFAPTGQKPDGSPLYTLPAIHDLSTGAKISDSWKIALYLEKTYPNTPKLFPEGTISLQRAWTDAALMHIGPVYPVLIPAITELTTDYSLPYWYTIVERMLGKPYEEVVPRGDEAIAIAWSKYKDGLDKINSWYEAESDSKSFLGESSPIWADLVIASSLLSQRAFFGQSSKEWKDISAWNNGRWGDLVAAVEKLDIA